MFGNSSCRTRDGCVGVALVVVFEFEIEPCLEAGDYAVGAVDPVMEACIHEEHQ